MTKLRTCAFFALHLALPACGQQLVEFTDAGETQPTEDPVGDAGNTDPSTSELIDASNAEPVTSDPTQTELVDSGPDAGSTEPAEPMDSGQDAGSTDPAELVDAGFDAGNTDPTTTEPSDTNLDAGDTDPTIVVPVDPSDAGDAGPDASDASALDASDASGLDASGTDILAPTVVLSDPAEAAVDVSITKRLSVTLSEPMNEASISDASFTLRQGGTPIPGTVTYLPDGTAVQFVPDDELALNTVYTATLTTGAEDVAGNSIAQDYTWSFTTSACAQALVDLGSAGNFAVLAGSTLTSTGPTSVTGDLGVSPGTAIIGFPPGIANGGQHAGNPTAAQGIADLTTGYDDAAGRTLCAVTVSGNLGGQTLTPGLYTSTSSLEISSGDLTLDALGDEDAVFIFQMASTLTTTAGREVILSGGAKASNVFWQVGTSATLGTTTAFEGTLMADQAITLNSGATLNGRLLARIAAVSLDSNTVVRPE